MNLHKSKIDWCTHTWNPVTGCLHGCDYCYAKRFIARFEPHSCEMVLPEPLEFLPKGSGCFIIDEPSKLYDENVNYLRSTPYPKGFAPTFHGYAMDYPTSAASLPGCSSVAWETFSARGCRPRGFTRCFPSA